MKNVIGQEQTREDEFIVEPDSRIVVWRALKCALWTPTALLDSREKDIAKKMLADIERMWTIERSMSS